MIETLRPLEYREREVIRPGTEILGGVLLTRAGIVVDYDENPEPYREVVDLVKGKMEKLDDPSTYDILNSVFWSAKRFIFHDPAGYKNILESEATARGINRLSPDNHVGLSRFIRSSGICHQSSLLEGATIRLLQEDGFIGGNVGVYSQSAHGEHPDRHTQVIFSEGYDVYRLDINHGVDQIPPRLIPS